MASDQSEKPKSTEQLADSMNEHELDLKVV